MKGRCYAGVDNLVLHVERLARFVVERETLNWLVEVAIIVFVHFDQVKTGAFIVLIMRVTYLILVQAVNLVVYSVFHLRPINAPVFQFIQKHKPIVLILAKGLVLAS